MPEYTSTGYDNYQIDSEDTHRNINYRYHTNVETMTDFLNYTLLNSCNPHNEINFKLTLNNIKLSVGDILHIPLINNEKAFNIDYSKVDYLNGQPIYPLWIIMSTDVGLDGIKIKAIQLHYLGTTNQISDGNHGFIFPEEDGYDIVGNVMQYNTNYKLYDGIPIPNWNFNPNATIHNGIEIPYYDSSGDGNIGVDDLQKVLNYINGDNSELTDEQIERLTYKSSSIDILTVVDMINIILESGE